MYNITEKKSFVKYFLSWDCESEFVGFKAGFKIIKGKNITVQNGKLSRDFFLKDLRTIEISVKIEIEIEIRNNILQKIEILMR